MEQSLLFGWEFFTLVIIALLAFDLGVLQGKKNIVSFKNSVYLSLFYIAVSLLYGLVIYYYKGTIGVQEYLSSYLIEKILSIDNIFIMMMIFNYFAIPVYLQRKVLFYGILGAIFFRWILITTGLFLVQKLHFILYFFGAFLVFTGIKLLLIPGKRFNIEDNIVFKLLNRFLNIKTDISSEKFILYQNGKIYITSLLVALIIIEFVDIIFAIDSIIVVFSITTDPYIVYTSNMFAILGFRAIYFCLAKLAWKLKYLNQTLSVILIFIGSKIFIQYFLGEIPVWVTLSVSMVILSCGVILSLIHDNKTSTN